MLSRIAGPWSRVLGVVLLANFLTTTPSREKLVKLKTEFDREADAVRKAKKLSKLGNAEFEAILEEAKAGEAENALRLAEQYRDQVRTVHAALVATRIDAQKHPAGFKQLQISVREAIRHLNDISISLPYQQRPPFQAIRQELETVDQQLLQALFPRPPQGKKLGG